jgi:K+-transporting ATPase ATPase A chain
MAGLSVQMFLSAGTGMSVALALTRSFINNSPDVKTIGNFWVDCTRMIIWILLPLSFILSLVFTSFGIPQSLYEAIASQEAIKLLGTNGAGFFNAGSAHPLENPSAVCNLVQTGAMLLVVASLPQVFGKMTGEVAQGKTLLKVMFSLYLAMLVLCLVAQWQATHPFGATLEGMDTRFGWVGSIFFNVTATTTGTGATSVALSSLPPLAGLGMLINILSGSVIFGGVGSGLYHIILYALLAVFLAGLMVGRTPEYLGKKIEAFDMKMVVISLMFPAFLILGLTAIAVMVNSNAALNPGPHGLTEIFYAFVSTVYNNGSSFAGLKTDSAFYHVTTIIGMVGGRFAVIIAVLALAGNLVQKPGIPVTSGTFPTTGGLFSGLLIAVIIITSGLVFFPIIALGPLAEQVSSCLIPLLP